MKQIMCEGAIDGGASRIRGWHNSYACRCKAKFKVTYKNGIVEYLCGRCKNKLLNHCWNPQEFKIEQINSKGEVI